MPWLFCACSVDFKRRVEATSPAGIGRRLHGHQAVVYLDVIHVSVDAFTVVSVFSVLTGGECERRSVFLGMSGNGLDVVGLHSVLEFVRAAELDFHCLS